MLDLILLTRSQTRRTFSGLYIRLESIRSIDMFVPRRLPLLPCCPSWPHVMGIPEMAHSPFCSSNSCSKKIHGAFDGYFMAVFFCPAIDVSQFRGEKVNAVFVATFGLALSVAMRATGSLTAITNKLAASFEPGRKFFI